MYRWFTERYFRYEENVCVYQKIRKHLSKRVAYRHLVGRLVRVWDFESLREKQNTHFLNNAYLEISLIFITKLFVSE